MNGIELKDTLHIKRPKYCSKYKDLMEKISTKGDATGKGSFSTFGAFYQTYMYAFLIGYKLGYPKYIEKGVETSDFNPIGDWKPSALRDYILMILMNNTEKFQTPISLLDLANASSERIDLFITQFIKEMEAYANAGLEYLQDKWENHHIFFEDPFVFVNFIEEIDSQTKNV